MSQTNSLADARVPATCGLRDFLVARVGGTHVAVPADRVDAVLEARAGNDPPCDEPWVGGWFVHRDRMFLAVRLDGRDAPRSPVAKRIVVRESDHARFAIDVDEVYGPAVLDDVMESPFPAVGWHAPKDWLRLGVAFDGRVICRVDVDAVAARLAG